MELIIFSCSLILFCATVMITITKRPYQENQPKQNHDTLQAQSIHLINITDDLKENGQIGIIVYRMTKMTQPTGFDIYNRRGEIIKKKYLLDRII